MATQAVLKYLRETNRPYSANDILQNMHKEYSKAQIQKGLDELAADGSIIEKVYGKQKVYCIKQEDVVMDNDDELNELNAKIIAATELLTKVKSELSTIESKLKTTLSEPTTEVALKESKELEELNNKMEDKVKQLKESTNLVPEKERTAITKGKSSNLSEYRKRKKICLNVVNEILENYPKPKKVLLEDIGIDQDGDPVLEKIQP